MTFLPATMFAAPVVINRGWLKSIGPDLEKIVREESRKAEEVFGQWDIDDIKAKEDIWKKNGGEVITMSPEESKKYVDTVAPVAAQILAANPRVKEDYDAILAAAKKYK
jgi:C4-dicarboxylate-binding protein DctP